MLLSVSGLAAACSTDAMRLSDSFYSGASPQGMAAPTQQVSNAPLGVDTTSTGSIGAPGGGLSSAGTLPPPPGGNGGYGAAASVTRSQLPPPPGSAAYQPMQQPGSPAPVAAYPSASAARVPSVAPQPRPAAVAAAQPKPVSTAPAASSAPSAPAQQVAAGGPSVTVQPGDSLNAIARRAGISISDLRAANGLATDNIRIGQTLNLPAGAQNQRVAALGAPATTLQAQAAARPAPSAPPVAAVAAAPAQPAPAAAPAAAAPATTVAKETETAALAPASTGIDQFRWPVQGRVVKGFGDKVGSRRNDGVNISVPSGTPVKAAENGVVIYAGEGLKEFGKTVLIKHDNGLVTVYGHADDILVERGATVRRGDDIAKAGMTGDTDAPMLHFEVRKDSTPVDPMTYLR